MMDVSLASNEYGTGPEPQLRLCGAWLAALNGTPVAEGRFVCERKRKFRRRAEGAFFRKKVVGGCPSVQIPSWLVLAAGAELQQANIWAEPLAVLSIFSLLLWVRGLGPLPTNRGMQRMLSSRIVWNGMLGIISSRDRNGGFTHYLFYIAVMLIQHLCKLVV